MGADDSDGTELRMMRRVALAMLVVGGVVCAAGLPLKHLTATARDAQGAAAAGFVLCAAVLAIARPRRRALEAVALVSVVLLCVIMATSNAIGTTPFFFLWPLVFLAYFGSRRLLIAGLAGMAVTLAVATAVNPYDLDRFDAFTGTVTSVGLMAWLVSAMTRREANLRHALSLAARTDALTGLLNRRGLTIELERLTAAADAPGLAVVMVDLDEFKRYNDRHGHLVGDAALRRLGATLTAAAGPDDLVARFGGEEFTVVLPGAGAVEGCAYAEQVAGRLRAEPVAAALRLTVSAGVAALGPEGAGRADALLLAADEALYAAKAAGRDCTRVYGAPLREAA